MNYIVIDSVDTRANKLIQRLNNTAVKWQYIDFLSENDKPDNNTLYLIHHSDGYVGEFAMKINSLENAFVLFYSGGGLSADELKAQGDKIFFYAGGLNSGVDEKAINIINEIVSVISKEDNVTKVIVQIKKVLGFDEQLEKLLEPFATANPFKTESSNGENLKQAKEALNKYINSKAL
ncbi:MAG: hypothetical protein IPN29_09885 [Saprospiraceae bacterium]|nr:hypothetical protein [Saprospiraceae bacterium]